jgi:4-diphosphocytidyl-2-C-methyl-D-erythritol kinase
VTTPTSAVTAVAPAKINLLLRVGAPDSSGYHPLVTVFQALDLWDEVTVEAASHDELVITGPGDLSGVPTDSRNIVWRAADALADRFGQREPLKITVTKRIPVAGGMAGGSADAAATLIALNELWQMSLGADVLTEVARGLGADVPFSLLGGCALGQSRGDELTPLDAGRLLHVVILRSPFELSTPLVYSTLDTLRAGQTPPLPSPAQVIGMANAEPDTLAILIGNDLQEAAIRLAPAVGDAVAAASLAGATAAMVSGSGPTVWGLCRDDEHARGVSQTLTDQGWDAFPVQSTALGAHLRTGSSSPTAAH